MPKSSRRPVAPKVFADAPKVLPQPSKPVSLNKSGKSWLPVIIWLVVVAVSVAYRFAMDRKIAVRELPRDTDIFLVSYPKSGNFWLRFLLAHTWMYSQSGEANWHREIDFHSIEDTIPDLEYGPNRLTYHVHDKLRAFKSQQPFAPGAVPGQCAATVGPMDNYQCACPNCPPHWRRILHMVRDGRDVMCSYYHSRRGLGNLGPKTDFEDFLKADIYPGFSWPGHVNSYLDLKGNSSYDILTVKYEDLHSEPFETMLKISKWAGLDHREEIIRRAIAKSSFKSMRRKEEAAGLRIFDEKYPDRDERWRMMRKGTPGGWEECFKTPASKDIWNELAFKTMYSLGYVTDEKW